MKRTAAFFIFIFSLQHLIAADIAGGHKGNITTVINYAENVISACEEGFIVLWDVNRKSALERFQLTANKIDKLIVNPQNNDICIVETGSFNSCMISVWNFGQKEKLFSLHSSHPVTYINYSANGSYIMAAGFNGSPLTLINSATGEIVSIPDITGSVVLAVTGRAERNILLYLSGYEGEIVYLDINSGSVTASYHAPGGIIHPVIFGNNRFIAGVNYDGLLLIDAASGEIFDRVENADRLSFLCPSDDGFYFFSRSGAVSGGSYVLNRYSVDRNGMLARRQNTPLSFNSQETISAIFFNTGVIFASDHGNLFILDRQNRIVPFECRFQTIITEIAAGEDNIAFLSENGQLCLLPLDYRLLETAGQLELINKTGYTRITPFTRNETDHFFLWQTLNTGLIPLIISCDNPQAAQTVNHLINRSPLRAISILQNRILSLDSSGNISVRNLDNMMSRADFSYTSLGTVDAAFIDSEHIILCRSITNNNNPFVTVNFRTGETVPIIYRARSGLSVFADKNGNIYGEAVGHNNEGNKTSVIDLSAARSAARPDSFDSFRLLEYHEEADFLSIAESSGRLAIACGNDGAAILANETINFKRTNGLPVKLAGHDRFFISLDSEGNIAWHNNSTGETLAVFSLYEDGWILTSADGTVTGSLSRY
jgi:WD40 repeat protein